MRGVLATVLLVLGGLAACGPRARPVTDARSGSAAPSVGASAGDPAAPARGGEDAESEGGDADQDGEVEASDELPGGGTGASAERTGPEGPCADDMALVAMGERRFCVDRYEASLVEVLPDGSEQPYPHYRPVDGHDVRAVSVHGVYPQGFISEVQAQDACAASGKRLCTLGEWKTACMGPKATAFPYGDARSPGTCHDQGKSAVLAVFGAKAVAASTPYTPSSVHREPGLRAASSPKRAAPAGKKTAAGVKGRASVVTKPRATRGSAVASAGSSTRRAPPPRPATKKRLKGRPSQRPASVDPGVWAKLNEPALGQVEGALSRTGEHAECTNGWGVVDMVGNLHEWVATDLALPHGTFAGGYYLDTAQNGDGCHYRTVAHAHDYHDYSTGFRCCADAR